MEAGIAWLASWAPGFLRPYLPKPIENSSAGRGVANQPRTAPAVPSAAAPATRVEVRPTVAIATQHQVAKAPASVTKSKSAEPERSAPQAQPRAAHGTRGKVATTVAAAEAPAPPSSSPARASAKKPGSERSNPFGGDSEDVFETKTERPAKHAGDSAPAKASAPTRSGDGLDDLMAGVGTGGGKPNVKHSASREIDAMLKDVQKTEPEPSKPKRPEPAALPSLTAADIATAMSGVKAGANACGKRFGQDGVADLGITVGKDGRVTNVVVRGKLADSPTGQCVAKAVRGASFPHNSGLKFDYRINVQ